MAVCSEDHTNTPFPGTRRWAAELLALHCIDRNSTALGPCQTLTKPSSAAPMLCCTILYHNSVEEYLPWRRPGAIHHELEMGSAAAQYLSRRAVVPTPIPDTSKYRYMRRKMWRSKEPSIRSKVRSTWCHYPPCYRSQCGTHMNAYRAAGTLAQRAPHLPPSSPDDSGPSSLERCDAMGPSVEKGAPGCAVPALPSETGASVLWLRDVTKRRAGSHVDEPTDGSWRKRKEMGKLAIINY
jgi:hypothetical protein